MAWPAEAYRNPVDATTDYFVNAVYSANVINHVRSNLVAVPTTNTVWKKDLAKGNTVYIPVMTTITASAVDPHTSLIATAVTTGRSFGTTAGSVVIDLWKEAPVAIDDSTKVQTQVSDLLGIAASNAAYALEAAIDLSVTALYSTTTSTWAGSDGQTFDDNLLIALMEGLDEANVPRTDRALICDPSTIADIYKIDKFMSRDYNQTTFTTDAYRGKINVYELPVFVTNNLTATTTGNYGILMQKECIGTVIQSEPKTEAWREPLYHSDVINVSAFWGSDVLRSTFGAYFYTRKS